MVRVGHLRDSAAASADGDAFGRVTATRTATDMMQPDLDRHELITIGTDALATILDRADAMARAGLDREIVAVWVDAAADAFHSELDRAAALVAASSASGSKH